MYELMFADTFHRRTCVSGEGVSAHKPAADDTDLPLDHDSSKLAAQMLRMMESKTQNSQPKQGPKLPEAATFQLMECCLVSAGTPDMVCRAADQK